MKCLGTNNEVEDILPDLNRKNTQEHTAGESQSQHPTQFSDFEISALLTVSQHSNIFIQVNATKNEELIKKFFFLSVTSDLNFLFFLYCLSCFFSLVSIGFVAYYRFQYM